MSSNEFLSVIFEISIGELPQLDTSHGYEGELG